MDYRKYLAADAARLREVAARDLLAEVPSCPGWTATDLVRHVAEVYLHKTECMRRNARPTPWPPDLSGESPLELFDRAYAGLAAEFADRPPQAPAWTWYEPEQHAGFWLRRMAQETVIHRIDAELAAGEPAAPVPDDLAVDGVDEVLERFLAYGSVQWREDFGDKLDDCDGRAVRVVAGERAWLVRLAKEGVTVGPDASGAAAVVSGTAGAAVTVSGAAAVVSGAAGAAAVVSGAAQPMLLWLWRRAGAEAVTMDGDPALVAKLRDLLGAATI